MAKSKSFFGLRKGSTKTLTFQVVNGAQVTKDRVAFVKNPRTESQMANRCLMATASAAYRAMREIVDHSFEGYTYGQQNMSQFIAQNITLLRNNAAIGATEFGYNRYRDRAFHPGAYKISKGSLTPTLYTYEVLSGTTEMSFDFLTGELPEDYTIDDIAASLGLSVGEMTTICVIYGSDANGYKFGFLRIKCIGMGNVPVEDQTGFKAGFQITSNLGDVTIRVRTSGFGIVLTNALCMEDEPIYSGVIYSRHTTQGWLRSTAYIEVPDGVELTPDYDTALATYPQGSSYVLNGGTVSGGGGKSPVPTPIAPEGVAQIFADAACTQYPNGQLDKVFIRFNNKVYEHDGLLDDLHSAYIACDTPRIEVEFNGPVFYSNEEETHYPIEDGTILEINANELSSYEFDGQPFVFVSA